MKINVTQKHINQGISGDKNKCPICNAIRAVFPHELIEVGGIFVSISKKLYRIPRHTTDIDNQDYPLPFEFDMYLA